MHEWDTFNPVSEELQVGPRTSSGLLESALDEDQFGSLVFLFSGYVGHGKHRRSPSSWKVITEEHGILNSDSNYLNYCLIHLFKGFVIVKPL